MLIVTSSVCIRATKSYFKRRSMLVRKPDVGRGMMQNLLNGGGKLHATHSWPPPWRLKQLK